MRLWSSLPVIHLRLLSFYFLSPLLMYGQNKGGGGAAAGHSPVEGFY
jgi:hypothetical protein